MANFVKDNAASGAGGDDPEHPILATPQFLAKGIPELNIDDFEFFEHAADGGWGSVFKYRRKSDNKLVALKFFGMNGTARPNSRDIEDEICKDNELNHLECCAKLYGYIVDSYSGLVADKKRFRKEIVQRPPHLIWGKRYRGRYPIKVSECLEKDVMNTLIDNVKFGQKAASTVFRNLIVALNEIHNDNIVHRDLKPENFMFVDNNIDRNTDLRQVGVHDLDIKLIDFGTAVSLDEGEHERISNGNVGTKIYNAPETCLRRANSKASDVWQAGVTLWVILFQRYPYANDASNFRDGSLHFPHSSRISENCKDLFARIFTADPSDRITCKQILEHSWIRDYASLPDDDFGEEYRDSIKEWVYRKQLRVAIEQEVEKSRSVKSDIEAIVERNSGGGSQKFEITTNQYRDLQKAFVKATGGSSRHSICAETGLRRGIDCTTFCRILNEHSVPQLALPEIYEAFDLDNDKSVSYYEFLTILTSFREIVDQDDTHSICKFYFEMFDVDASEDISRDEFHQALKQLLIDFDGMTFEDVTMVFDTVDINHDGAISYQEFKAWFDQVTRTITNRQGTNSRRGSATAVGTHLSTGDETLHLNSTEGRDV